MADETGRQIWIRAGLEQLARGGIDSVRVEVLAVGLGVTKGGFYRRFKHRQEFLTALLEVWATGRIGVIEQQTELDGGNVRERLRSLIRLYAERHNADALRVELAIRQWAQSDPLAATTVADVDRARLKNVARLYAALGLSATAAQAQAFLFYAFVFGQSLMFVEQSGKKRTDLLTACAATLTDIDAANLPDTDP